VIPEDQQDRDKLLELLGRLGEEEPGRSARIAMCEAVASGLARVGQVLWVSGAIVGPHRVSGESRRGFGDDRVVGRNIMTAALLLFVHCGTPRPSAWTLGITRKEHSRHEPLASIRQ